MTQKMRIYFRQQMTRLFTAFPKSRFRFDGAEVVLLCHRERRVFRHVGRLSDHGYKGLGPKKCN